MCGSERWRPRRKQQRRQADARCRCEHHRRQTGYAQEPTARRIGVDRSYFGAIERGESNVTVETLVKIARGLDTTCAALLTRAEL